MTGRLKAGYVNNESNYVNVSTLKVLIWLLLTHWGRVTHICVSELTIIGPDNGLSPGRRQAIIWTNAGILLIGPLGTNFNEILIEIHTFSFKKMHLKMSSAKWRPFCLGLNVLTHCGQPELTHCGLVTLYGDRDLGQHWLRQWLVAWRRHQSINWTNVDWSSVKSRDIHIRAISQEMPQPSITKISLKIMCIKFHSNLPGANEFKQNDVWTKWQT